MTRPPPRRSARTTPSASASATAPTSEVSGRPFPNPVAVYTKRFVFTTLSDAQVSAHAERAYYHPTTGAPCELFTMDEELAYAPFARDFGPLNLSYTMHAIIQIHTLLKEPTNKSKVICLYCSPDANVKCNMALIVSLYFLLVDGNSPSECFRPIAEFELKAFRDAGNGVFDHGLSVQDCLYGIRRASDEGLFDPHDFDSKAYRYYELPSNGDLNFLGPFIPFASPMESGWESLLPPLGQPSSERNTAREERVLAQHSRPKAGLSGKHAFRTVLDVFHNHHVGLVVRLNDELYDKRHFTDMGMDHVDMYFDDGSNPTDDIVRRFIAMASDYIERGYKVAVHCKAGLGRTGVLIGAYLIYKHAFSAQEVIGYMRIVRPGMVVGPQQIYMLQQQMKWVGWAARDEAMREMATREHPPVQIATPPSDDDTPLPHIRLPSPKRGDAVGQPRKGAEGGHSVLEHGASASPAPAAPASMRGTKRGASRPAAIRSGTTTPPPRRALDLDHLERSPSLASVASANDRPRKRLNDAPSPLSSSARTVRALYPLETDEMDVEAEAKTKTDGPIRYTTLPRTAPRSPTSRSTNTRTAVEELTAARGRAPGAHGHGIRPPSPSRIPTSAPRRASPLREISPKRVGAYDSDRVPRLPASASAAAGLAATSKNATVGPRMGGKIGMDAKDPPRTPVKQVEARGRMMAALTPPKGFFGMLSRGTRAKPAEEILYEGSAR